MQIVLDRFEIARPLARGGMGMVHLARDLSTGREVVVKVLRADVDVDGAAARFEHEIEVGRAMSHALVPRLVAEGTWAGQRVTATEYVDGVNLGMLVASLGERLPTSTAVSIIVDVLSALHEAHCLVADDGAPRGLVHRDVSPQNIVCDRRGRGWLIDFGVSTDRAFADHTPGVLIGKLAYMAPEQACGFEVDGRADQFAAGVVLWELLSGRRLVTGVGDREVWEKVVACDIPNLADVCDVDVGIADVVARMLSPKRTRRFATCAAAADALLAAAPELGPALVPAVAALLESRASMSAPATVLLMPEADVDAADSRPATRPCFSHGRLEH
ncbi:MAG: serine/threonine-protein kinase [Deltaproteobacteria bacterium]|nr:serine/threonine-protein kinase [Deltaproteobacteria bacterium]